MPLEPHHRSTHRHRKTGGVALILLAAAALGLFTPLSAFANGLIQCNQWNQTSGQQLRDWVTSDAGTLPADYKSAGNNEILFLVIRPDSSEGSGAENAIVFFNGTGGIMTDWSYDMLKGSSGSLCEDYTLVLFDYPGIGGTTGAVDKKFTFDAFSRDADTLITYINDEFSDEIGTQIEVVHPLGWSLGSLAALKFAGLAKANGYDSDSQGRQIGNLFLIATKPGGDILSGSETAFEFKPATGHQAECVTQVTNQMREKEYYANALKEMLLGLTFPYVYDEGGNQSAYGGSDDQICQAASITPDAVTLVDATQDSAAIETECGAKKKPCTTNLASDDLNRNAAPYNDDEGLSHHVYLQERNIVADWNYAFCQTAASGWTSTNCQNNQNSPAKNSANGGVCLTVALRESNNPGSSSCMPLDHITGELIVINGKEDLFIQHVYGRALVHAYAGSLSATLHTYDGSAGHAVLLTDPEWVGGIIVETMGKSIAKRTAAGPPEATPSKEQDSK